jgi:UDP-arabinose 4-epimerase
MATVLVTGGAGYIGSHACKALAAAGHTPVAYDNLSRGNAWAVKWGPLEQGDILDQARLEAVIERHRPTAAMHFAALAYVAESVADPAIYYRTNVQGTLTLLEAMRRQGVDRLVFSSSCATYGSPAATPIAEEAPQAPINPYGATKLISERMLRDYAAYGLKTVALRYFNAAGADPDGEIGEAHDPETHLIPLLLDAAATGAGFVINGDDYATPDGTCVRDYVHVADLAAAHVLACERLGASEGFEAFNLGTGHGLSVAAIVDAARQRTGCDIKVAVGPRRAGDPPVLTADPSRAREQLGWTPRFSGLEDIIDTAWRWRMRNSQPVQPRGEALVGRA